MRSGQCSSERRSTRSQTRLPKRVFLGVFIPPHPLHSKAYYCPTSTLPIPYTTASASPGSSGATSPLATATSAAATAATAAASTTSTSNTHKDPPHAVTRDSPVQRRGYRGLGPRRRSDMQSYPGTSQAAAASSVPQASRESPVPTALVGVLPPPTSRTVISVLENPNVRKDRDVQWTKTVRYCETYDLTLD